MADIRAEPVMATVGLELGSVYATPGALHELADAGETVDLYLARHLNGDWGEVAPEDREENRLSLEQGFRVLSAYTLTTGVKIWIITEADRSATTVLLPEEY
jgi:hypothetical protein